MALEVRELKETGDYEGNIEGLERRVKRHMVIGTSTPFVAKRNPGIPKINDYYSPGSNLMCIEVDLQEDELLNAVTVTSTFGNPNWINSDPLTESPRFYTVSESIKDSLNYRGELLGPCGNIGYEKSRTFIAAEIPSITNGYNPVLLYDNFGCVNSTSFLGADPTRLIFLGASSTYISGTYWKTTFKFVFGVQHIFNKDLPGQVKIVGNEYFFWFPTDEQVKIEEICAERRNPVGQAPCKKIRIQDIGVQLVEPCRNRIRESVNFYTLTTNVVRWL